MNKICRTNPNNKTKINSKIINKSKRVHKRKINNQKENRNNQIHNRKKRK
jgi:hypothetical protein